MSQVPPARPMNLNQQYNFNPISNKPVYGLSQTMSKAAKIPSTIVYQRLSSSPFLLFFLFMILNFFKKY
jgi:hypothetical protein